MDNSEFPIAATRPGSQELMGIPVHPVDADDLHQYIRHTILTGTTALITNVNIHCVNLALRLPWLKAFLNQSQVIYCDGDGVRWGMKMLGLKIPPKVPFTRWIWQLAAFCEQKRYRLYFLGAQPGVAQQAASRLKQKYPGLEIVGVHDGYFEKTGDQNDKVIAEINRLNPDILIIGFGMPLQEKWLMNNWRKIQAHIFLPGGAVFDYTAGKLGEAPDWVLKLQMEWLFRVYEEPGRLAKRYLYDIPYFFSNVFMEKMRLWFTSRRFRIKPPESS